MDRVGPSISPTAGDDVDNGSTRCFVDDAIRDDDSPYANHLLLYHDDVAPV